jgi:hypothetical protein
VTSSRRLSCVEERPTSSGLDAIGRMPFSACAVVAMDSKTKKQTAFFMPFLPNVELTVFAQDPEDESMHGRSAMAAQLKLRAVDDIWLLTPYVLAGHHS